MIVDVPGGRETRVRARSGSRLHRRGARARGEGAAPAAPLEAKPLAPRKRRRMLRRAAFIAVW